MNTEEYILFKNTDIDIEKIKIPDFSEDEINLIKESIEFTRHIQEIDKLFRVFKVNLDDILLHYQLMNNDTIIRKIDLNNTEEDIIIINALVINYISSAKTFTESVETFLKQRLGEKELDTFRKKYLSIIYDNKFSYRLLIRLRDYAQHGHLPVYMSWDKKCSFDLEQILYTSNFTHNSKIKNEMIDLKQIINNEFEDNPRIVFTMSIAEFKLCILKIYISFINVIRNKLVDLIDKLKQMINDRPDIIYKSDDALNGFILYSIEDESVHCFNPKEKPIEMLNNIKNNAENEFEIEKEKFDEVFKNYNLNNNI